MAKNRRGAPTKLTAEIRDKVIALVRRGSHRETACAAVGVSSNTLRRWLSRAEEGGPHSLRYRRFAEDLDKAEAEAETLTMSAIVHAGKADWRALAWILERRGPQRWSPRLTQKMITESQGTLADLLAAELEAEQRHLTEDLKPADAPPLLEQNKE